MQPTAVRCNPGLRSPFLLVVAHVVVNYPEASELWFLISLTDSVAKCGTLLDKCLANLHSKASLVLCTTLPSLMSCKALWDLAVPGIAVSLKV